VGPRIKNKKTQEKSCTCVSKVKGMAAKIRCLQTQLTTLLQVSHVLVDTVHGLQDPPTDLSEVTHLQGITHAVRLDVIDVILWCQAVQARHREPVHVAHCTVPSLVVEVRRPEPT